MDISPLISDNRAEASIIAICMSSPAHLAQIADELLPASFANPALADTYAACLTLAAQGVPPDMIAVSNHMRAAKTLDAIGGVASIAELACMFAPPSLWRGFVDEILESAEVRQAVAVGQQFQQVKRRDDIDEALQVVDGLRRREVSDAPETARPAPPWDAFDRSFAMLAESIGDSMSLPFIGALVASHAIFGGFMGKTLALQLSTSWQIFPNIYTVCSGDTGSGKSATSAPLMSIAMRLDAQMCALTKNSRVRITARVDALRGKLAKIQAQYAKGQATDDDVDAAAKEVADAEEMSPGIGDLVIQDATGQAIAAAAHAGDGALMSLASEAREVFALLNGKYNDGAKDANILLAGSTGDAIKVNRKGGTGSMTIEKPCFSSAWFIQPDVYERIICDKELSDNGFIRRLLSCFIEKCRDEPDKNPPPVRVDLLNHFEERCTEALAARQLGFDGQLLRPSRVCHLDDDARDFLHGLRCEFKRDDSGDPWCESFVEFCGKWALILHAAQHGPDACDRYPVTLETLRRADAIMRWFRANRAHGAELSPEINRLRTVSQKATEGFAARDVYKCTPQLDAQQAKALISRWISDGYVRTSQRVYRGKPIVTHHVTDKGWKLLNDTK